mmetsp:Transcript_28269/g.70190  ORF Transcript_28269/g.70190 Transcript_28269/m.70190 type:complete len:89 (+) Transcript_28269:170-436(+)
MGWPSRVFRHSSGLKLTGAAALLRFGRLGLRTEWSGIISSNGMRTHVRDAEGTGGASAWAVAGTLRATSGVCDALERQLWTTCLQLLR